MELIFIVVFAGTDGCIKSDNIYYGPLLYYPEGSFDELMCSRFPFQMYWSCFFEKHHCASLHMQDIFQFIARLRHNLSRILSFLPNVLLMCFLYSEQHQIVSLHLREHLTCACTLAQSVYILLWLSKGILASRITKNLDFQYEASWLLRMKHIFEI